MLYRPLRGAILPTSGSTPPTDGVSIRRMIISRRSKRICIKSRWVYVSRSLSTSCGKSARAIIFVSLRRRVKTLSGLSVSCPSGWKFRAAAAPDLLHRFAPHVLLPGDRHLRAVGQEVAVVVDIGGRRLHK